MQSVVSKKFDTSQYDFENSGWYKKDTVLGEDVYLLTVFFTDPTKICSKGRSAKDFENQGIGNILWFEKTDGSLVQAPLTMDKADDGVSKHFSLLHFVDYFHVASLFSAGVDNKKVGVDNEKALELTNSTVFHRGRQ